MSYKKTIIRKYFNTLLEATVASVASRVFSGRINPKNNDLYPYLTVSTKDDDVVDQYTTHTSRELELHIGCIVKNNDIGDGDFDEVIENLMFEVEEVMSQVLTVQTKSPITDLFALFNSVSLTGSTTKSDNSSGSDLGIGILTYKVEYDYNLPIAPIDLNDFDIQGSIDHIQITNPGVPINDV